MGMNHKSSDNMDFMIGLLINIALLSTFGCQAAGKLIVQPRDTDVKVNHSTYFNCSTDHGLTAIFWFHGNKHVYTGIAILEPYHERFKVDINIWNGTYIYNLVIHSVQPGDAGQYSCTEDEGVGEKYSVQLVVLEYDPICRSNRELNEVIGQNACNIEPDEVELECSVTYHGYIPPQLEWKKVGENSSTLLEVSVVTSGNQFVSTLKRKGDIALNNSSYVCETKRTTQEPIKCNSKVIHILYAINDNSTVNKTIDDEIHCNANTSQSCNYKWKWLQDNDFTIESSTSVLKARKPGWHRCEAQCYLRNRSCNLLVMRAMVYGEAGSSQTRTIIISVVVSVVVTLILVFVLICVLVYCYADRPTGTVQQSAGVDETETTGATANEVRNEVSVLNENPSVENEVEMQDLLTDEAATENEDSFTVSDEEAAENDDSITDETNTEDEYVTNNRLQFDRYVLAESREPHTRLRKEQVICGLTILDQEVFILRMNLSRIEVYESRKFKRGMEVTRTTVGFWSKVKYMADPEDIVACPVNKCLYVSDRGRNRPSIIRIDPTTGNVIKSWVTSDGSGRCISIANDKNVILSIINRALLLEYTADGELIRKIELGPDTCITDARHAVKLPNGQFIVCHSAHRDPFRRVCLLSTKLATTESEWRTDKVEILKEFCLEGESVDSLWEPRYLSVDKEGSVLVLDGSNNRAVLLNSNLDKPQIIISKEILRRTCFDDSTGQWFVADNDHVMVCRVKEEEVERKHYSLIIR